MVQKQSSIFISKCMSLSTNATSYPWNQTIERILDHLRFHVAACCNNRFTKLSQIVLQIELFDSHIDLSQWIGDTLSCRDFFRQSVAPEQLTSSKQIVKIIQLVLIGPFQPILGGSWNVCLSLNTVISVNIAWKSTRHVSKFKLNIVEYTVTYLSVIALLLFTL